jgi:hypothetical protein
MKKLCFKCREEKSLNEFSKKHGKPYSYCKECDNKTRLIHRRTKRGLIFKIYSTQKRTSIRRKYDLPNYTKYELLEWCMNNSEFHIIYNDWVKNNYINKLYPSIDRLDDYKSYTLDNIQITTWEKNNKKGNEDIKNGINLKQARSVIQYDLNNNLIKKYYSIMQAERETGINHGNIWSVCNGKYKQLNGYVWKYAD